MPALEDTRGPLACAQLWTASYEPALLECRYRYRAGRGAWEAVRALTVDLQDGREGSLGDAEVQGCVAHLDPTGRWAMVRLRLDARAVLHRRRTGLKAGLVDTDGPGGQPEPGTPPGGTVSPGLAHG